ncbi:hypothetical protein STENM223S_08631 [Streptomyces tendae]
MCSRAVTARSRGQHCTAHAGPRLSGRGRGTIGAWAARPQRQNRTAPGRTGGARDRDGEGRARNARPRDGLGRPLPYGSRRGAAPAGGGGGGPDESVAEAQRLLDEGKPFHAHEVFEDAWKSGPEAERELWRGLAQMAVGLTHAARGNVTGGARLLRRGAGADGVGGGRGGRGRTGCDLRGGRRVGAGAGR